MNENNDKIERVLSLYSRLINGDVINKAEEAQNFGVNERSIQRDIEDIRSYLDGIPSDSGIINTVIYDRAARGYRLEKIYEIKLSNSEILAICKILLSSRAFTKKEMEGILERLINCCVPKSNQKAVKELIRNEEFHYIELQHRTPVIDMMWEIGTAIRSHKYMEISYRRLKDKSLVKRKIKPAAIMFSEYYFYLAAFIDDAEVKADFDVLNDTYPTIYRIDRIKKFTVLDEQFHVPYKDRFEEGEFRKRIQFMYGGKLQKVTFKYSGLSIESVLDRLPTARILDEQDGVYTVTAEVFGKGIEMWMKSQGDVVEVIGIK